MATDCVGIVIFEKDSVLLVRHTELAKLPTGSYGFPAGRIEEGEQPLDAAVRELEEETGLITFPKYLFKLPEKKKPEKVCELYMKKGIEKFIFQPYLCIKHSGKLTPSAKTIPKFKPIDSLDELHLVSDDIIEISKRWHKPPVGDYKRYICF